LQPREAWYFIAATNDHRFRAFDSRTGRELWAAEIDGSGHATADDLSGRDGKQYDRDRGRRRRAIREPSGGCTDSVQGGRNSNARECCRTGMRFARASTGL